MSSRIRPDELRSKADETEKIYCHYGGVVMLTYNKNHKPKISVYEGC